MSRGPYVKNIRHDDWQHERAGLIILLLMAVCMLLACSAPVQPAPKQTLKQCMDKNEKWRKLKLDDSNSPEFWSAATETYRECTNE